jgi:hypothetical protein
MLVPLANIPINFFFSVGPQHLEVDDEIEDSPEEVLTPLLLPIKRGASQQSRATMMASSYGIDLSQLGTSFYEDAPNTEKLRVEKKIRMRVRYTCHRCSTHFGRHYICSKCEHGRCRDCHKFPDKRRRLEEPRDVGIEQSSSEQHQPERQQEQPQVEQSQQPQQPQQPQQSSSIDAEPPLGQ